MTLLSIKFDAAFLYKVDYAQYTLFLKDQYTEYI